MIRDLLRLASLAIVGTIVSPASATVAPPAKSFAQPTGAIDAAVAKALTLAKANDCRGVLALLDPAVAGGAGRGTMARFSAQMLRLPCLPSAGREAEVAPLLAELRAQAPDNALVRGYQILDDAVHPDAKRGKDGDRTVASLYDLIPAAGTADGTKPIKPVGQWNTARIVLQGTHGEHWLNGKKVLEFDRDSPQFKQIIADSKFHVYPNFGDMHSTAIVLQDHGFPVSFRNIKIRVLPPPPAK